MKKIICLLLATIMVLSFAGCKKTDADSALLYEAYGKIAGEGFLYYSLYDIDKNGITELILYKEGKAFEAPVYNYSCSVYTVEGKEAVCIGEFQTKNEVYGSEDEGIWSYSSNFSGEELRHYALSENVLKDGTSSLRTYNDGDMNYLIQEKPVSETEYNDKRNKLFGIEMYDDISVLDELKDDAEQIGEVIGHTIYTDIVTKINGCDIPSCNVDGRAVVSVEDLESYGFDKKWTEETRSIDVLRNFEKTEVTAFYEAEKVPPAMVGKRAYNVLRTDIMSYVNGELVTGYNINGEIYVCFEDLDAFGLIEYDEAARVLSLTMEWLSGGNYIEYIGIRNRIVVTTAENGDISASLDGIEIWRKNAYEGEGGVSAAYIEGDTVYYGTDRGFYAANLYTGENKWSVSVDASEIKAFATTGKAVTALLGFGTGVRHIAADRDGVLIYDESYTDEDGTGASLPDAISEFGGNVVTLQFTDAAGAGINMWQKINIAA